MDLGVDGAMRAVLRRFMGFDVCFFRVWMLFCGGIGVFLVVCVDVW
jgi:hypothetical protein